MSDRVDPRRGLPRRPFYYTLDQIADMLALSVETLTASYLWRAGIDKGIKRPAYLSAVDLSRATKPQWGLPPELAWRVPEGELIRWLTYHRFWIMDPDGRGVYDPTAAAADEPVDGRTVRPRRRDHSEFIFIPPDNTDEAHS